MTESAKVWEVARFFFLVLREKNRPHLFNASLRDFFHLFYSPASENGAPDH